MSMLSTRRALCAVALPAVALASASTARAVTIGFSTGTYSNTLPNSYNDRNTYDESGFRFAVTGSGNHVDSSNSDGFLLWHDGPQNSVNDNPIRMSLLGGGTFTLTSFDAYFGGTGNEFTASAAGYTPVTTSAAGTYTVNWTNVTEVFFNPVGTSTGLAYLDNVIATPGATTPAAVPLPPAALAGLALLGVSKGKRLLRRRTTV